ncbi:9850_t:CDS:2, partial [Dentiscutata heterogama]
MSKFRQELKTIEIIPNLTGVIIFCVAFAIRFILFQFSNITETLGSRVEIVTPVTSFTRLTEGLYLFDNGVPPYDGGAFHQAPLFLACFQLLSYLPNISIPLTYIITDLLIAYLLADITRIKQHLYQDFPRIDVELEEGKPKEIDPWIVSGLYLFNPLTVASCLSQSTLLFTNLSIVLGTYYSLKRLLILSYLLVDSWDFMQSTYGIILFLSDLTPNIGLFWYFFIEMFDQFRSFFLVVFQLHAFIFVVPISIKFRNHPLFVVFLLSGIMAVFKSYPSIGDVSLYLAFLPIYSEIIKCSGNANFFYAITLVYTVGNIILLVDATYSMLRREFDIWNPELRH